MPCADGDALRILREAKGWRMKPFADELGISLQYLCDIERGHRKLKRSPDLLKRIAEVLEVPTRMIERREDVA